MCGIFGLYLKRRLNDEDIDLGKMGMVSLTHRGPDSYNYWVDRNKGIFLGHTRLAIIDTTEKSSQPMVRSRTVLVYNGEIYNYKEIAKNLNSYGVSLSTTGDTEVLLQSWLLWRKSSLKYFDGMYAFALYDGTKLYLVTDLFGEKPLYVAQTEDGIYFSSEPGPLRKLLTLQPYYTKEDIISFLNLGFLLPPSTGFANLERLGPATCVEFENGNECKREIYWEFPVPVVKDGKTKALGEKELDRINELLIESIKVRVRADVPLGIFLSSGIDSSLTASIISKELKLDIEAYTVSFPGSEVIDESQDAKKIAEYLHLPHRVIESKKDLATLNVGELYNLYGEPNDNLTVLAVYQMADIASRYIRVALSGMGGDEIFYGYNRYQFLFKYGKLLQLPPLLKRILFFLSGVHFPRGLMAIHNLLSADENCVVLAAKNNEFCRWLWHLEGIQNWASQLFETDISPEIAARQFDIKYVMPGSFIPPIERGSMRASLEVRTPFLNRKLLEYISTLDQHSFLIEGQKCVLRKILQRYLPKHLIDFPKRGFIFPRSVFLRLISEDFPDLPGIDKRKLEQVWLNRFQNDKRRLALRIAILNHFLNCE